MATVTILSSGRRRWTSEEKRRLVEESLAEGASASDVVRRNGVDVNRIYAWRRRLRDRMPAKDDRDNARIVPVTVASFSGALSVTLTRFVPDHACGCARCHHGATRGAGRSAEACARSRGARCCG